MANNVQLKFIDGNFVQHEAQDILLNIFQSEIQYYKRKNLSSQVRFGVNDEISAVKIPALEMEMNKLGELLAEARLRNVQLVISSEINISFLDTDNLVEENS